MNKLLAYYQKELDFLKKHGKMFARRFPKIARRLGMNDGTTEDPHISRLIESFALLTSRIHQRLDDDLPEVIDALLSTLAPQFLRPLPSCCIVMLEPDPQRSGLTGSNLLPAGTALFTRQDAPLACQFQTVYPVTLLPLSIRDAALRYVSDELSWQLQLRFEVWPGARLENERIRLYLHGPDNVVNILYTLLCSEISRLTLRQEAIKTELCTTTLSPVGFEVEEALLTRDPRIAPVHILLLDYFWFPQKFSFIDIQLPAGFIAEGSSGFELEMVFQHNPLTERLEKLAKRIDANFFRLHCTPAVNLFAQRAEPITLSDASVDYPIVPDTRHHSQIEVWSVQNVAIQRKVDNRIVSSPVLPLMESNLHSSAEEDSGLFWQSFRREMSVTGGIQQKLFIAFSQRDKRQTSAEAKIVSIDTLCTNHSLPHQRQYGLAQGDFDSDAPIAGLKIAALTHPTRPINPPEKSSVRWHFLSQLSLNHQLLQGEQGAARLKALLALYNYNNQPGNRPLYNLIASLHCQPVTMRIISNDPHSLARGIDLTVTFHHEALQDPEYYLLCSLLDRLLALYAPVNSFTRLTTCIEHEVQTRHVWPVRAGRVSWL